MSRAGWRPVVLLVAGALVVLAGCSPSPDPRGHTGTTVADLRAGAAIAPCPTPTPPPPTTAPPGDSATPTRSTTPGESASFTAPGTSGTPDTSGSATGLATPSYDAPVSPEDSAPSGAEGQILPEGTLPCLAGGPDVPLRQVTGVPMVINLWATWCLPCRTELPAFQAAYARADPARLRVLGVATQDPGLSRQLTFAVDTGLHMPNLVDDRGVVAAGLGIRGLPATLFVGADGTVVHVYNGPPLTSKALRDLISQHLRVTISG
ncbi:MAG TPA: TlpA disulfide reductase family protein [Mycobacteriales bacterium]